MNWNDEFIEKEKEALQKARKEWMQRKIKMGGDIKVIAFIADILFHGGNGVSVEDSVETTRNLFEAGYCYYFAKMLEDAFPNGQICVCYPFGHIVYVYDGVMYDINGVSDTEYVMLLPISELKDGINDFRHVPGLIANMSEDALDYIAEHFKRQKTAIHAISEYDQEMVRRTYAITKIVPDAQYVQYKTKFVILLNRLLNEFNNENITKKQVNEFMEQGCYDIGVSYPLYKRYMQPLTKKEIQIIYDIMPLYFVREDGSDAMAQDNGYTLDECLELCETGCEFYLDI